MQSCREPSILSLEPSPGAQDWERRLRDLAQGRDAWCPVCSPTAAQSVCWGWQAASPCAASCPPNAGLPSTFPSWLCPNEMFSYLPLTGLGPIQVSVFIQTLSLPPPFLLLEPPTRAAFCRTGAPPSPAPPCAHKPLCLREMGGFCAKARLKKKPSNPPRKIPMAQLHSWARNKAVLGALPSAISKAPSAQAPLPGVEGLRPSAAPISRAWQSKADLQREGSGSGAQCARRLRAAPCRLELPSPCDEAAQL